jgi:monofunctional biosynthetic peptidoglycan transglycosylase
VIRKLFLLLLVAALLWIGWEVLTFPDVAALATHSPKTTAFMELRREQLREAGKSDVLHYQFVPYSKISPYLRRAVLVAEDDGFYEHDAIDTKGLKEALERDWRTKKLSHGGSTITQQLAKNLYLSPSRNPLRKIREFFIARALERHLTKKRILEIYLNVAELGETVYGAEAAAHFYFHTSASALTPSQAALLAGSLPNPRIMVPSHPNKRLRWRQRMVLSRMKRWGYTLEKEVLTAKKPEAAPAPATPPPADKDLEQAPATDTATPAVAPDAVPPETVPPPPASEPSAEPASTDSASSETSSTT